ncbi:MAG: helix-turn-helix domain-containing protein [Pyrinomonadaceae bacterium]
MSLTLGEKLRQAREERGISISQIAEQTRISALYLESIENDDYRKLPGGIFNKGFIKSFAKIVGVDEQEALQDYAQLIAEQGVQPNADEPKTYRPEVLTDERSTSSLLPTVIFAVIILGLMTWGILFALNYFQRKQPTANTPVADSNANTNLISNLNAANASTQNAATTKDFAVEFKAVKSPVSLISISDGEKQNTLIKPDKPGVFQPKESLRLKYSNAQTKNVQMTINGKPIALPTENGNRNVIEFEIKKDDFQSVLESGQVGSNFLIKSK